MSKITAKNINYDQVTLRDDADELSVKFDTYFAEGGIGKNMFDKDTMVLAGYYLSTTTGAPIPHSTSAITTLIPCLPNTEYVFSGDLNNMTNITKRYYDATQTVISFHNNGLGVYYFTTPANCYFLQMTIAFVDASPNYDTTQIEAGHTATAYEAYTYTDGELKPAYSASHLNEAYLDTQLDSDDAVVKRIWIEDNFKEIDRNIVIIKSGNDVYLRTVYDTTRDLVQVLNVYDTAIIGDNNPMNFSNTYLIPNTNLNTNYTTMIASGVSVHGMGDDACPMNYNGSYIGANHGCSDLQVVTVASHDKTVEDVGSEWIDGDSRKWYLLRIVDTTHLWFLSENIGAGDIWDFDTTINGNLTHSADATHTASITVSSYTSSQLEPSIKNQSKRLFLDDEVEVLTDGVYYSKNVKIEEYYEIVDPSSALDYVISQVGSAVQPDLNNGVPNISLDISYIFNRWGGCVLHYNFRVNKEIDVTYISGLQSAVLTKGSYAKNYVYVPNTTVINDGSNDWDLTTLRDLTSAPASNLNISNTYWESADNPPYRFNQYLGTDTTDLDLAFTQYFNIDRGCGKPDLRKTYTNYAGFIATTKKNYPLVFNSLVGNLATDSYYEIYGFRGYTNPKAYSNNASSVFFYEDGNDVIVMIDYHSVVEFDKIVLPTEFTGKFIQVLDKHSTTDIHNTVISENGIYASSSGTYGYLILKLTNENLQNYYDKDESDAKFVPYTGANANVDLGDYILKASGVTLASTELLTIGTGTLTHDGTEFVANDDVNLGSNDIQATEFRMGANATIKFNAITNSIDFIIN